MERPRWDTPAIVRAISECGGEVLHAFTRGDEAYVVYRDDGFTEAVLFPEERKRMEQAAKRCGTCSFFTRAAEEPGDVAGWGFCFRYPPQVNPMLAAPSLRDIPQARWPEVHMEEKCGEYVAKGG